MKTIVVSLILKSSALQSRARERLRRCFSWRLEPGLLSHDWDAFLRVLRTLDSVLIPSLRLTHQSGRLLRLLDLSSASTATNIEHEMMMNEPCFIITAFTPVTQSSSLPKIDIRLFGTKRKSYKSWRFYQKSRVTWCK